MVYTSDLNSLAFSGLRVRVPSLVQVKRPGSQFYGARPFLLKLQFGSPQYGF